MSSIPTASTATASRRWRPLTRVVFDAKVTLSLPAERVWQKLTDWGGHGEWIPLTRIDVDPADPNRFVAWSGFGRKLALEDRMHATGLNFDGQRGTCHVDKLGPVLVGFAEVAVEASGSGTQVVWHEDVTVPYLPKFLSGVVGKTAAALFASSLRRMAK